MEAANKKQYISDTYVLLLQKTPGDKITVKMLIDACGLSRQTFYYHFDDIDAMIEWTFKNETEKICSKINYMNIKESAELYAEFFKKYDTLLVKALKSESFIRIYNLIHNSFESFLTSYIKGKRSGISQTSEEREFFITYCASASSGLVILEIQKDERNYSELMNKLAKSLKSIA